MTNAFDASESLSRKEEGIARAVKPRKKELEYARQVAKRIALESDGTCHADQVQRVIIAEGIDLGPAAGALFCGKNWKWTGRLVNSERINQHAAGLRVWEYVGEV